jgi:hypothetical protein
MNAKHSCFLCSDRTTELLAFIDLLLLGLATSVIYMPLVSAN